MVAEKSYPDVRVDEKHLKIIHTKVSEVYDEAIELLKSDRILLQPLCNAMKPQGQNLDDSPTANWGQKRKRGKESNFLDDNGACHAPTHASQQQRCIMHAPR